MELKVPNYFRGFVVQTCNLLILIGKMGSMLKVARISDANDRILIKDIKGLVQDVSFALTSFQIILGVVDEAGNLFVYNIEDKKTIKYPLI